MDSGMERPKLAVYWLATIHGKDRDSLEMGEKFRELLCYLNREFAGWTEYNCLDCPM
jgi:hypothetical protein